MGLPWLRIGYNSGNSLDYGFIIPNIYMSEYHLGCWYCDVLQAPWGPRVSWTDPEAVGSERCRPHALLSHVSCCWSISFPKWISIYWKFHFLLLQHFICFISSFSYPEEIIQILCSMSIFNKLNKTWPLEKNQTLDCEIITSSSPRPSPGTHD